MTVISYGLVKYAHFGALAQLPQSTPGLQALDSGLNIHMLGDFGQATILYTIALHEVVAAVDSLVRGTSNPTMIAHVETFIH